MSSDLLNLAYLVKKKMESRFEQKLLEKDYIYEALMDLIKQYSERKTNLKKTDIGVAAIKMFDSDLRKKDDLLNDILSLDRFHNRRVIMAAKKK